MPRPDLVKDLGNENYIAYFDAHAVPFTLTRERCYSGANDSFKWDELHAPLYRMAAARVWDYSTVLDVGCGSGYGSDLLSQVHGAEVFGIDNSEQAIAFARRRAPRALFQVADMASAPLQMGSFDFVVSVESIEHVTRPAMCLSQIAYAMRPGAMLFLTTPDAEREDAKSGPSPFHVKEFTAKELCDMLAHKFKEIELLESRDFPDTLIAVARRK